MQMGPEARSVFVSPKATDTDEDWLEATEEASDMSRKSMREAGRMNKVASFLNQKFWKVDKTWPSLWWKVGGWQTRVEMYFPALNLAVDRYLRPTSMDRQEAAFKANTLKALGVKYVALFPETKLKELSKAL